jgi:hypothetical protein
LAPGAIGTAQIALGSITAAQIALGSITSAQIAAGSLGGTHVTGGGISASKLAPRTVQVPIVGTCPVGRYLRGVTAVGAVVCEPFFVPTVSTMVDDPAFSAGWYSSIAIGADQLPIIIHGGRELRVTKCGNAACTTGNVTTSLFGPGVVSDDASIAIGADGLPVISHGGSGASLQVTKCGNAACTAGNVTTTVDDPAELVGEDPSIAIGADGLPVISHGASGALRVTKCGNAACTAGNVSTTVDNPGGHMFVGGFTSIAIGADGLPVISHQMNGSALRVTKCGNAACSAGNVSTTVDDPENRVGFTSSIAIGMDGLPVISHHDATARTLRVTDCGNAACTAGNVSTMVDDLAPGVGAYTSIAISADGLPVISYQGRGLRVTKCGNPACTTGNVSTTVDNHGATFTSIAIGTDGLPVISFMDFGPETLWVTKCGTQSCR